MSAERLNHRVVLEMPERTPDGAGGVNESWVALGALWASVAPRRGGLSQGAPGTVSQTGFTLTVRAAPVGQAQRPEAGHRLRMGTRVFRITAVTEAEPRGLYLRCECEEELTP